MFFRTNPRPTEDRALSYQDVWGSGGSSSAITGPGMVSGGLRLIPVYAATSMIADLVSTAPLRVFREAPDGTRTLLASQPQLVTNPSPLLGVSRITWLHQCMTSLLLRGNAYGYIVNTDSGGKPSQIVWLNPDDVTVYEVPEMIHRPTYWWRGRLLDPSLLVHIAAYTVPGSVQGLSPLALFKAQIETGLQAQQFGSDWFKNGAQPSAMFKNTAKTLSPEDSDVAKQRFKSAVKSRDVLVTGKDWDYTALSVKANESQFLETIKANATQIASIYRVSPEDVGGETGTALTYKTLEQDQARLTARTLGVWCERIAAELTYLLPRPQYARFDLDKLAQGDKTSRMVAHAAALAAGVETLPEARADEDKPPLTPEEVDQWQQWYRTSSAIAPVLNPRKGTEGGPNA